MTKPRLSGKTTGVLLGAAVVLLAFGYLVWGGIGSNLVYFLTPKELLAKGSKAVGTPVRLGGLVQGGTVQWNADTRELRFRLVDEDSASVPVLSMGVPPQMFTEGQGVVVEGVYTAEGVFKSQKVMVKHSNEYRAPEAGKHPAEYYRQLFEKQGS
ncbi:MAG: cytochrome c maturation protein CcmE [Gemmatimonadetes bacterium]|nr:cytochrome c maturation protein CcmE [Gemmatimonadota bacterium]